MSVININKQDLPKLISTKDIMERFSIKNKSTICNWGKRGLITPYKIGGLVRYSEDEVNSLVKILDNKKIS
jgi:hypothetical protein